ncbi:MULTISPECIES: hypothetical protein [unclassified Bacillus cereus group]|uniref:hypothetical protein n=1 Tax=unclassified Bacillus cereus group TaxID=2750818 RepID=UPI00339B9842
MTKKLVVPLLFYSPKILPHLKVEQIYYLECLISVFLILVVQIGYNVSRLTSIFMYYKKRKDLLFPKAKNMYCNTFTGEPLQVETKKKQPKP